MKLTTEIIAAIDHSVLCWLATVSIDNVPNVSPKEVFCSFESDKIIVANIASPQTVKNIVVNNKVCISFIDILVQKGFQLKGSAKVVNKNDVEFENMEKALTQITRGKFPFTTITAIRIDSAKPIIAPKYLLYPTTTESEQIASAKKSYGLE